MWAIFENFALQAQAQFGASSSQSHLGLTIYLGLTHRVSADAVIRQKSVAKVRVLQNIQRNIPQRYLILHAVPRFFRGFCPVLQS